MDNSSANRPTKHTEERTITITHTVPVMADKTQKRELCSISQFTMPVRADDHTCMYDKSNDDKLIF